jgi:hypothetical protein
MTSGLAGSVTVSFVSVPFAFLKKRPQRSSAVGPVADGLRVIGGFTAPLRARRSSDLGAGRGGAE